MVNHLVTFDRIAALLGALCPRTVARGTFGSVGPTADSCTATIPLVDHLVGDSEQSAGWRGSSSGSTSPVMSLLAPWQSPQLYTGKHEIPRCFEPWAVRRSRD